MEKDNIVELIKKCLALSKSPNENEAALAIAKAQELLLKYNLDMASIKTTDNDQSMPDEACMINEIVEFSDYSTWQATLLNSISIRNFCKVIRINKQEYHILGTRANVRSVEAMYNWLEPQITRLILQSGYKRGEKSAYAYGIISTIGKRLDESLAQYKRNNPMSTALIINVQHAIDIYYKEQYPHTTSRRVSITGNNAYYAGQSDGHKVSINNSGRQISSKFLLA